MSASAPLAIEPHGRFWALREGTELIALIVYKKGAKNVRRVIEDGRSAKEPRS